MNIEQALLIHLDGSATPSKKGQATKVLKAAGQEAVLEIFFILSNTQEQALQPLLNRLFK